MGFSRLPIYLSYDRGQLIGLIDIALNRTTGPRLNKTNGTSQPDHDKALLGVGRRESLVFKATLFSLKPGTRARAKLYLSFSRSRDKQLTHPHATPPRSNQALFLDHFCTQTPVPQSNLPGIITVHNLLDLTPSFLLFPNLLNTPAICPAPPLAIN